MMNRCLLQRKRTASRQEETRKQTQLSGSIGSSRKSIIRSYDNSRNEMILTASLRETQVRRHQQQQVRRHETIWAASLRMTHGELLDYFLVGETLQGAPRCDRTCIFCRVERCGRRRGHNAHHNCESMRCLAAEEISIDVSSSEHHRGFDSIFTLHRGGGWDLSGFRVAQRASGFRRDFIPCA